MKLSATHQVDVLEDQLCDTEAGLVVSRTVRTVVVLTVSVEGVDHGEQSKLGVKEH